MLQIVTACILLYSVHVHTCQISISGTGPANVSSKECGKMNSKLESLTQTLISKLDCNAQLISQLKDKTIQDCKRKPCLVKEVAFRKITGQSTPFGKGNPYKSKLAVDGDPKTFSLTNKDNTPSWWVDLGRSYQIRRIEIINRKDCCGKSLHDLDITVGSSLDKMSLCAHFKGPGTTGQHLVFRCGQDMSGRYVKMTIQGPEYLQLGEVKVYALVQS